MGNIEFKIFFHVLKICKCDQFYLKKNIFINNENNI